MARAYSIEAESGGEDADETRNCLKCGYGLTGLGDEGICPECGTDFGGEWVITGYKNRGGPGSNVAWGIAFLLLGSIEVLLIMFSNPSQMSFGLLWNSLMDPCSIVGVIFLLVGLRGIAMARVHGGNLRWVLTSEGIYSIRGSQSESKMVPWSDVRRIRIPLVFGIRPRRWRLFKVKRRWGASMDLFRKRTPTLWVKGRTKREMIDLARNINQRFVEGIRVQDRGTDSDAQPDLNSQAE